MQGQQRPPMQGQQRTQGQRPPAQGQRPPKTTTKTANSKGQGTQPDNSPVKIEDQAFKKKPKGGILKKVGIGICACAVVGLGVLAVPKVINGTPGIVYSGESKITGKTYSELAAMTFSVENKNNTDVSQSTNWTLNGTNITQGSNSTVLDMSLVQWGDNTLEVTNGETTYDIVINLSKSQSDTDKVHNTLSMLASYPYNWYMNSTPLEGESTVEGDIPQHLQNSGTTHQTYQMADQYYINSLVERDPTCTKLSIGGYETVQQLDNIKLMTRESSVYQLSLGRPLNIVTGKSGEYSVSVIGNWELVSSAELRFILDETDYDTDFTVYLFKNGERVELDTSECYQNNGTIVVPITENGTYILKMLYSEDESSQHFNYNEGVFIIKDTDIIMGDDETAAKNEETDEIPTPHYMGTIPALENTEVTSQSYSTSVNSNPETSSSSQATESSSLNSSSSSSSSSQTTSTSSTSSTDETETYTNSEALGKSGQTPFGEAADSWFSGKVGDKKVETRPQFNLPSGASYFLAEIASEYEKIDSPVWFNIERYEDGKLQINDTLYDVTGYSIDRMLWHFVEPNNSLKTTSGSTNVLLFDLSQASNSQVTDLMGLLAELGDYKTSQEIHVIALGAKVNNLANIVKLPSNIKVYEVDSLTFASKLVGKIQSKYMTESGAVTEITFDEQPQSVNIVADSGFEIGEHSYSGKCTFNENLQISNSFGQALLSKLVYTQGLTPAMFSDSYPILEDAEQCGLPGLNLNLTFVTPGISKDDIQNIYLGGTQTLNELGDKAQQMVDILSLSQINDYYESLIYPSDITQTGEGYTYFFEKIAEKLRSSTPVMANVQCKYGSSTVLITKLYQEQGSGTFYIGMYNPLIPEEEQIAKLETFVGVMNDTAVGFGYTFEYEFDGITYDDISFLNHLEVYGDGLQYTESF